MLQLISTPSDKIGLPPGILIHVGERMTEHVKINIINYDKDRFNITENAEPEDCHVCHEGESITWIHVNGLHDTKMLESIGSRYRLHPLIMEDILNTDQRPKTEEYEDCIFTVLKSFRNGDDGIWCEQISIVMAANFVISFQESDEDIFAPVIKRIQNKVGRIRKAGSDYLAYALIDTIIDHYFAVTEAIEDEIELIEETLMTDLSMKIPESIQELKRKIIFIRKAVLPIRELTYRLERSESEFINDSTRLYLRDLYDHVIRITEHIDGFQEMAKSLMDLYHSSVSSRMNEIMKVLTIISTVFIPLSFIAGVYGMNFKYMPELEFKWGYPVIWILIISVVTVMLVFFRKKKWI